VTIEDHVRDQDAAAKAALHGLVIAERRLAAVGEPTLASGVSDARCDLRGRRRGPADPRVTRAKEKPAEGTEASGAAVPEAEEIDALAETIDPHYRSWLYVVVHTGMRWSEAAGLKVRRVDLLRRRVEVAEQLVEVRGHPGDADAEDRQGAANDHRADLPGGPAGGRDGGEAARRPRVRDARRLAAAEGQLQEAGVAPGAEEGGAGGAARPRLCRHTHVALLIHQGEKPLAIAKRVGHSDVAFTMSRYGHLMKDEDDAIAGRMEQFAPKQPPATTVVPLDRRAQ
jgi:integrase